MCRRDRSRTSREARADRRARGRRRSPARGARRRGHSGGGGSTKSCDPPWSTQRSDHCWLVPEPQAHRMMFVPLAVPRPLASRHRPDCTPVMVPLALTFHCWLACPLQSQMMTAVPFVVPAWLASRHLLPYTTSCLRAVCTQVWFAPPVQSHSCVRVPLVSVLLLTSRQRLDCAPTTAAPLVPGSGAQSMASRSGAHADALPNSIELPLPLPSDTMTDTVPCVVHEPVGGNATAVGAWQLTVSAAVRGVASPLV